MQRCDFSSRNFPERDAAEVAREFYASLGHIEIDPLDEHYVADVSVLLLPDLALAQVAATANTVRRTPTLLANSNDDLHVQMLTGGCATISQVGQEDQHLRAGDVWLSSNDSIFQCAFERGTYARSIAIPRAGLTPHLAESDFGRTRKLRSTPELQLLMHYAAGVMGPSGSTPLGPDLARQAAIHLHDLTALALGAKRDAAHRAQGRGLRAARYKAVVADLLTNLTKPELSLDWLAARHSISPRYLRDLFYGEQTSFSDFVRNKRLDKARDMLTDTRFSHYNIATIAYDVGFGDLSGFNRMFQRRFRQTPSDLRATAREVAAQR